MVAAIGEMLFACSLKIFDRNYMES